MPPFSLKDRFRKASLGLVDGLLLALCAAAITYLSLPLVVKLSTVLGNAAEPNKNADIQAIGVLVFLGVFLFAISAVFLGSFVAGVVMFAKLPARLRLAARIGIFVMFLPVFAASAKRGPRRYFDYLIDPRVRENEARLKSKNKLERALQASTALTVEREPEGIRVTNNTDQLIRLQVVFRHRVGQQIILCYAGESESFPPAASDQQMICPPRETKLFPFSEARTNGSQRNCGFDDYAVWGWDDKSVPVYLSQKAHLF
jgi:hypothetical protein